MFGLRISTRDARKFQNFNFQTPKKQNDPVGRGHFWDLTIEIWRLHASARFSSPPPSPPTTCRRLALPGACRQWGSVMRYRSATVAEFHGLLCFVELIERTSGTPSPKRPSASTRKSKPCADLAVTLPFRFVFFHKPKRCFSLNDPRLLFIYLRILMCRYVE